MSAINFMVGADPELFIRQNGVFKSAFGLIPGTKQQPHKVNKGAVQIDGMALEFNIDPAKSEDEFSVNVQTVMACLQSMVPGYEMVASPVAHFDLEYFKQQPDAAKELGCDPDFNAWEDGKENKKPDGDRPFRTASGHVHIGWTADKNVSDPNHQYQGNLIVKNCDFFLGLMSLMYDDDTERRSLYGKAGACRYKPYGVEYRTLSNRWTDSEQLMRLVYRNTIAAAQATVSGNFLWERHGDIQHIINTSDVDDARRILDIEGIEYYG